MHAEVRVLARTVQYQQEVKEVSFRAWRKLSGSGALALQGLQSSCMDVEKGKLTKQVPDTASLKIDGMYLASPLLLGVVGLGTCRR